VSVGWEKERRRKVVKERSGWRGGHTFVIFKLARLGKGIEGATGEVALAAFAREESKNQKSSKERKR
jgi:hypothetical protein